MLLRIFLLLVLFYLVLVLLRFFLTWRKQWASLRAGDSAAELDDMVQDPHCLSYVPKEEAISRDGHYFCSEPCAVAYSALKSGSRK